MVRHFILVTSTSVLVAAAPLAAQEGSFRGWSTIVDQRFRFNPDQRVDKPYRPRVSSEVRLYLEQIDRHVGSGDTSSAARLFQQLIDHYGDSVLQVADTAFGYRYVGAAEFARYRLLNAPSEVRQAYAALAERRGRGLYEKAVLSKDLDALRKIARQFANAAVGQDALVELASLHFERGALKLCSAFARRALDFVPRIEGTSTVSPALRARALALVALSEGRVPDLWPEERDSTLEVAGVASKWSDAASRLDLNPPLPAPDDWPTYGGNESHDRLHCDNADASLPRGLFTLEASHGKLRFDDNPLQHFKYTPPIQPVRTGEILLVNNSMSVKAWNLYSQRILWEFEGPMVHNLRGYHNIRDYLNPHDGELPISRGLITGITISDDVVIANVQVPEKDRNIDMIARIRINDLFPFRGLVALSVHDGSLLWAQRGDVVRESEGRSEFEPGSLRGDGLGVSGRLDVLGPVAAVDDLILAVGHYVEGAVNSYLLMIDRDGGELIEAVPLVIGQQELSMFNMPFQEFTSGTPVVRDGMVFCTTNLGLMACVDIAFGDLRWLSGYDFLPIIPPTNYYSNEPRDVFWYHNPPVAVGSVLLATPHDSTSLQAFDTTTGKVLWQFPLEKRYLPAQLLGTRGGRAILACDGWVKAVDVETGRQAWHAPIHNYHLQLNGRGCLTDAKIYLSTTDSLLVLSADSGTLENVWRWPTRNHGGDFEPAASVETGGNSVFGGNVLVFPDMLIAAHLDQITVLFDSIKETERLEAKVLAGGADGLDLVRLGSLYRLRAEYEKAAKVLAQALESAPGAASARESAFLRGQLFETLMSLATSLAERGEAAQALERLVVAQNYADSLSCRVRLTRFLVDKLGPAAPEALGDHWLSILLKDHALDRELIESFSNRPISVGVYAAFMLAERHKSRGELDRALEELQRLFELPSETLLSGSSIDLSREAIEKILAEGGAQLRTKYDALANQEILEAMAEQSVERLGMLLRRYPNATDYVKGSVEYCRLQRERKHYAEALQQGTEVLRQRRSTKEAAILIDELARVALDLHNTALADGFARVRRRLFPELDSAPDLASPVDGAPAAIEVGGSKSALPVRKGSFEIRANENLIGAGSTRIRGEPLIGSFEGLVVGDHQEVRAVDPTTGTDVWPVPFSRSQTPADGLLFQGLHAQGVLILVGDLGFVALDIGSGRELWRRLYRNGVRESLVANGVLVVPYDHCIDGDEGATCGLLEAIEPRSGLTLWTQSLSSPQVSHIAEPQEDDGIIAVVSDPPVRIECFEAVSGARRMPPKLVSKTGQNKALLLADLELLLVPELGTPADLEVARKRVGISRPDLYDLCAYRLDSGELLWRLDGQVVDYRLDSIVRLDSAIGMIGGVSRRKVVKIDPLKGLVLDPPLEFMHSGFWSELTREDPGDAVRTRVYFENLIRKNHELTTVGLTSSGQWSFSSSYTIPDNCQQASLGSGVARKGQKLVFALDIVIPSLSYTDLIALDTDTGEFQFIERFNARAGMKPTHHSDLVQNGDRLFLCREGVVHVFTW